MSTVALKEKLINKILLTENPSLLQEMVRLLGLESEDAETMQLSTLQKQAILKGQEDIRKGNFLTNEQANNEIDKWLNE